MPKMSMSCMIIRRGGIAHMAHHNERIGVDQWDQRSRDAIDSSLSCLNTRLIGSGTEADVRADIAGCDMARGKGDDPRDRVGLEISINTWLPPEYYRGEHDPPLTHDEREALMRDPRFMEHLIELKKELEKAGCVSAVLHMDEGVPHVHAVMSVRVKNDSKRSKKSEYLLNYKAVYGDSDDVFLLGRKRGEKRRAKEAELGVVYDSSKTSWGRLQTRLYESLYQQHGYERGELASVTGIIGLRPGEYRRQQAAKRERERVDAEIEQIRADADAEIERARQEVEADVARQTAEIRRAAEVEINDYRCNIVDAKKKMDEKLEEYKKKKEQEEQKKKEKIDESMRNAEIEREEKQNILGACQQDINNLQREINDLEIKRIEKERYITEQQENIDSKQREIEAIQEIVDKKLKEVRRQKQFIDGKFSKFIRSVNKLNNICLTSLRSSSAVARQIRGLVDGNGSLAALQSIKRALIADRHLAGDRRAYAARQRVVREIDALLRAAEERDRLQANMRSGVDEVEKGYDGLLWDDNNYQGMRQ